jgi:hypothetical protein
MRLLTRAVSTDRHDRSIAVTAAAPARAAAMASAPVPVPTSSTRRPTAYPPRVIASISSEVSS